MRKFLIESNSNGEGIFTSPTETKIWTLEEMLREINRDHDCTDYEGSVYIDFKEDLSDGYWVMAGSPEYTTDHDGDDCYRPYDEQDWEEGWYNWLGEEWHRIVSEVKQ